MFWFNLSTSAKYKVKYKRFNKEKNRGFLQAKKTLYFNRIELK
ncbi:hypothetical protein BMETH_1455_0 [methanotrophic bacterial endosymbiont of Bathymodiolus sp.]|nr:hypothetical protein BMETH_1455_0 [methanotrophic bacterial endosymbiont of Bathymodiolus sp.]